MFEKRLSRCIGLAHESDWTTESNFFLNPYNISNHLYNVQKAILYCFCQIITRVTLTIRRGFLCERKWNNFAYIPPHCSHALQPLDVSVLLTKVNQNIPLAKRPWANNRAGSTRILTDTPEKMKIDEDNRRKEKDIKKKERERKKLAPKNIFKPADKKNIEKKAR